MVVSSTEAQSNELNNLGNCFDWVRNLVGRRDAERLLGHVLGTTTSQLYTGQDIRVEHETAVCLREMVNRRVLGEPVEYITGECFFWTQKLRVTSDVLIPRPETEVLVESALRFLRDGNRVLDLGTGSGAIALALRSELDLQVVASDISLKALDLCAKNADRLNLAIETVHSDWYSSIDGSFQVIVSNPPYVADDDPVLTQCSLQFEPRSALASGKNGLGAMEKVISGSKQCLVEGGWLLVEHGYDQREDVLNLFSDAGFRNIECRNDYSDIPRVVLGEKSE